jgi:nitroreductase
MVKCPKLLRWTGSGAGDYRHTSDAESSRASWVDPDVTTPTLNDFAATPPASTATQLHPLLRARASTRAFDEQATLTDAELASLLEAARWAPSRGNTQNRRFLVGRRGDTTFEGIFASLGRGNGAWAGSASALVAAVAPVATGDARVDLLEAYDLGQAVAHLSVQAESMGLVMRQMAGFDPELVQRTFRIAADHAALVVFAIGRRTDDDALDEITLEKERAPRTRVSVDTLAFAGAWGSSLALTP